MTPISLFPKLLLAAAALSGNIRSDRALPASATKSGVLTLVRSPHGRLERFRSPVCVRVTGADVEAEHLIAKEIQRNARDVGLNIVEGDCRPNVEVVITSDRQNYFRRLVAQRMVQLRDARDRASASKMMLNRVIVVMTRTDRGPAVSAERSEFKLGDREISDVDVREGKASILPKADGPPSGFLHGFLILDAEVARDKTPTQIGDYASMRILGNTTDALPAFPSILRLFAGDWNAAGRLTAFDRLYLKNLYGLPRNTPAADFATRLGVMLDATAAPSPSASGPGMEELAELRLEQPQQSPDEPEGERVTPLATAEVRSPDEPVWQDEVTVTARRDGPALWRVRGIGDASITILGTVSPLPTDFEWPDRRVRAAIRKSRLMLVSSEPEADLVWMSHWTTDAARRLHQPKGRTLADDLGASDRQRLEELARVAGQPIVRYGDLRPAVAAMLLNADWRHRSGLSNTRLATQLVKLARKSHVNVKYVQQTSLLPTIDELPALDMTAQLACYRRLLGSVANEQARSTDQAKAWAAGDVGGLRKAYIAPTNCANVIPADARRRRTAVDAWTAQVLQALNRKHQQAFAMIDMTSLLAPDGVLAALKRAGASVDTPED